jgi:hypothetical protein
LKTFALKVLTREISDWRDTIRVRHLELWGLRGPWVWTTREAVKGRLGLASEIAGRLTIGTT